MQLRGSNGRFEGTYADTYEGGQGRVTLELHGREWRGTWEEPQIGRRGTLFRVSIAPDGRSISGHYNVTADGGRGNVVRDRSFRWRFVR